jgi:hypothetical protein
MDKDPCNGYEKVTGFPSEVLYPIATLDHGPASAVTATVGSRAYGGEDLRRRELH